MKFSTLFRLTIVFLLLCNNFFLRLGELIGARLISHAGSLLNLAKHPASTVQILGAEKALFKALKTKHDTPKYGIIYHAQVVGQASAPLKGKINFLSEAHTRVDAKFEFQLGRKVQLIILIKIVDKNWAHL